MFDKNAWNHLMARKIWIVLHLESFNGVSLA